MEHENKTRIPAWLRPSTIRRMDGWLETANCKSRSEFIEKSLHFYMGYLGAEDASEYLPNALTATLRGIVTGSADRTNCLLFKCAVEQGIMAHTIAAHFGDAMEDRRALRGYVTDEVKRTNGQIRFEEAQDINPFSPQAERGHKKADRQRGRSAGKINIEIKKSFQDQMLRNDNFLTAPI